MHSGKQSSAGWLKGSRGGKKEILNSLETHAKDAKVLQRHSKISSRKGPS